MSKHLRPKSEKKYDDALSEGNFSDAEELEIPRSPDSTMDRLDAFKSTEVPVTCSVKNGNVILIINSETNQRPSFQGEARLPRSEGSSQGDHVTAYASFIAAIINSSNQEEVDNALKVVRKIAKAILPDKAAKFDALTNPQVHDRDNRKDLTAALRFIATNPSSIDSLDEKLRALLIAASEGLEKLKSDMKDGALAKYAEKIELITNQFLVEIQSEKNVSMRAKGRIGSSGSHGSDTETAINGLTAISKMYSLMTKMDAIISDSEKIDQVELFSKSFGADRSSVRLGFNKLYRLLDVDGDALDAATKSAKIPRHINGLLKKTASEAQKVTEIKAYLKSLDDKLVPYTSTISNLFSDLFDFEYKVEFGTVDKEGIKDVRSSDTRKLKDLVDLAAKHIVVMFTAFNGIANGLDDNTQKLIIEGFLESVLKNQGWKDCKEIAGDTVDEKLKSLTTAVNKRFTKNGSEYTLSPRSVVAGHTGSAVVKNVREDGKAP